MTNTTPIQEVRSKIQTLDGEVLAIILLVLDQFDDLFSSNGYTVSYKRQSFMGGAYYLIYRGHGAHNKGYRIEVKLDWDEITFRISKPLTFWQKVGRVLFYALIATLVVSCIGLFIAAIIWSDGGDFSLSGLDFLTSRRKKNSKKRKPGSIVKAPNGFLVNEIARKVSPGLSIDKKFKPDTVEYMLSNYRAFFEHHLLATIKGEKWLEWVQG